MDDDFDALLAELEGEEQKAMPSLQSFGSASPAAQPQAADELDDLLSELGGASASAPVRAPVAPVVSQAPVEDDLDALMKQLDGPSASPAAFAPPAQQTPMHSTPSHGMGAADDLDDLLGQLGGSPAPAVPASAPALACRSASATPVPQLGGGDDLDALLGQLDAATAPAAQAPRAAPPVAAPAADDDLDALMSQLDIDAGASAASSFSSAASSFSSASAPAPGGGGDELDDLLNQLGGTPVPASPAAKTSAASPYGSQAASSPAATRGAYAASPLPETDDLDALISGLGGPTTPLAHPMSGAGGGYGSPSMSRAAPSSPGMGRGAGVASPRAMGSPAAMGSPTMGRGMGRGMGVASPAMGSPSMARGMGSAGMGRSPAIGRGMGSTAMGRGMGSPSMGSGMGSPSMGRGMGSPSMGRGMGSPSMGGGVDLDNLLGSLNQQMSSINDGMTASKGICAFCNKPIHGDVMQALGNTYHPEHFVCNSCQEPLGTKSFYESDGQPTCDRCYKNMFCPRCAFCNEAIPDRCITAMERKWHVKCFVCNNCLQPFPGGEFFEKAGMPYCRGCFSTNVASPCGGCGQPAAGGAVVNALNRQWHVQCFACDYCKRPFNGQPFFAKEGKAFCQQHYHQEAGGSCGGCKQPITGRCVDALGHRFHPNCFVCAYCMNPLSGGGFTEHHGSPYCHECHGNLF